MKANPGKFSFGSAGAGSTTHVAAVMVLRAAGLDMIHVPYRGVAPRFHLSSCRQSPRGGASVGGGTDGVLHGSRASFGRLALLEHQAVRRSLPGVPLVTETLKDCPPAVTYNGLLGPKGIPQEAVDVLSRELVAAWKIGTQRSKQRFSKAVC